jgi:hypothetical protein
MANVMLDDFIGKNRNELIDRCRAKVEARSSPPSTQAEIEHGVPMFLDQLVKELRNGHSKTDDISESAVKHGHDLLFQGFTIGQVVHDYGDVCQAITDLAVEKSAPISPADFRTLNRCLDNAIAGAVTEYAREQDGTRAGEAYQLQNLTETAITAFEVLQSGNVGVGGSTGAVVHRSLMAIRAALAEPPQIKDVPPVRADQPTPVRSK